MFSIVYNLENRLSGPCFSEKAVVGIKIGKKFMFTRNLPPRVLRGAETLFFLQWFVLNRTTVFAEKEGLFLVY